MKLEDAMKRLSEIVAKIESGADLDESLALYAEGKKLLEFCNKKIDEAQAALTGENDED